jgi:hypothetical protein
MKNAISTRGLSRRKFLAGWTAIGAGLLLGRIVKAESFLPGVGDPVFKEYGIATNGISLHVTELGNGPAVVFCHGFPDTSCTWRRQMQAVASAGLQR